MEESDKTFCSECGKDEDQAEFEWETICIECSEKIRLSRLEADILLGYFDNTSPSYMKREHAVALGKIIKKLQKVK